MINPTIIIGKHITPAKHMKKYPRNPIGPPGISLNSLYASSGFSGLYITPTVELSEILPLAASSFQ
jgi:hypothetical protein